ncbi:MAG TPA: M20/M25/M40 family metallo-hydrolase [Rhizomicrobium sp.]|nr:M20/M25/M40 family metallo-hydrolase [Rhizomicrobium sp.]
MRKSVLLAALLVAAPVRAAPAASGGLAPIARLRPDQAAFRAIYQELVETDTTPATGNCSLAASRMAARLRTAGFPDSDLNLYIPPNLPKDGGLIAVLHGSNPSIKPLLLMAHIDVVNVNRAEWKTDPFRLIEDKTHFHARGTTDDKAMAAVWVDSLVRLRQEGFRPRRDIKLLLACGEETGGRIKDAQWLAANHRDWIDAGFALNEGASGEMDEKGERVSVGVQAGEKTYQDYTLTTSNEGGHSARPHKNNAINAMSAALGRIGSYEFPVMFSDSTRIFFTKTAGLRGGDIGVAMKALLANPKDAVADALLSNNPDWHSMLRTTCVATMIKGGEERSALPEHVEANVNCRIFPGVSPDTVLQDLQTVVGDTSVKIELRPATSTGQISHIAPPPPPLTPDILGPVEKVAGRMWPGVPVIPTMSTGATDARFLIAAGIPTYGLSGMFRDPDGDGVHGVDERMPVRSLYEGRDFLYQVVKIYAGPK